MIELKSPLNFMGNLIDAGTRMNLPPDISDKLIQSGAAELIETDIVEAEPKDYQEGEEGDPKEPEAESENLEAEEHAASQPNSPRIGRNKIK